MRFAYSIEKPLNREPDNTRLVNSFITEKDGYDRNHGPIPYVNQDEHVVKVDGCVRNPLALSIKDIRDGFPQHEMVCVLQCAGNRRNTMRKTLKEVHGIDWGDGAVMNCRWKGAWLRDILKKADPCIGGPEAHVAFSCYKTAIQKADWYGSSIELGRAMSEDADVMVVLQMNGKDLTPERGFPVRMLVPGVAGCRSVKWLDRITVQPHESDNLYQRRDYKRLPPEATDPQVAEKYWDAAPALQDMPINSAIVTPRTNQTIERSEDGTICVKGYALPQGSDGPVVRVQVSADAGKTWQDARIIDHHERASKWSWSLWEMDLQMKSGHITTLYSRATDKGGNVQNGQPLWNFRGLGYDGYGEARNLTVV